jgi:hypothetical protein
VGLRGREMIRRWDPWSGLLQDGDFGLEIWESNNDTSHQLLRPDEGKRKTKRVTSDLVLEPLRFLFDLLLADELLLEHCLLLDRSVVPRFDVL